jgi:hypothetical protein
MTIADIRQSHPVLRVLCVCSSPEEQALPFLHAQDGIGHLIVYSPDFPEQEFRDLAEMMYGLQMHDYPVTRLQTLGEGWDDHAAILNPPARIGCDRIRINNYREERIGVI